MILVFKKEIKEDQIAEATKIVQQFNLSGHISRGEERTVMGIVGANVPAELQARLEGLPFVENIIRISKPYKLASREFKDSDTKINLGNLLIGGKELTIMAGPCSVEDEKQLFETAVGVKTAGAKILRGGAFKPRTSPYSFRGLGKEGLEMLRNVSQRVGLKVITEVMSPDSIELVYRYTDIIQVGARNMQNYPLLEEIGRLDKPCLLKRGLAATIEEWLLSAEYIMGKGNHQVILCERGIRTFETSMRNTLDLSAVPMVKRLSHLPVICDPSHATGKWYLVAPMAMASVAAGADGLLIEVHPDPDHAMSDGPQSLTLKNFSLLMQQLAPLAELLGRQIKKEL